MYTLIAFTYGNKYFCRIWEWYGIATRTFKPMREYYILFFY